MIRFTPIILLWLSFCGASLAQPNQSKWGLTDNLNMISVKRLNSFLSVPDIKDSKADMEIRLYAFPSHLDLKSVTSLVYKDGQWNAMYHSRKDRSINDPADATFPLNVSQIKNKKLDSVFFELAAHNVFILPDQSQTSMPHTPVPFVLLIKSNELIRGYRFMGPGLVNEHDPHDFREYKAIFGLFHYLNDGFPEKR